MLQNIPPRGAQPSPLGNGALGHGWAPFARPTIPVKRFAPGGKCLLTQQAGAAPLTVSWLLETLFQVSEVPAEKREGGIPCYQLLSWHYDPSFPEIRDRARRSLSCVPPRCLDLENCRSRQRSVMGAPAGSQLADPREACREAVGIISLCPSPVPFSRGSQSTLIRRLIRQKREQLAGQRRDAKRPRWLLAPQSSGLKVAHPSLLYPGINSYLPPVSLKSLLMLWVHPRRMQSSPSGSRRLVIKTMTYFPGRIGPTLWAGGGEPEP
ncbi:uncharacterized protein LOC134515649 [Chroicocephalus ridibundus]|uniref:uncharacterized protein LOC134515649 n=1 Tax=Chroicocephalus ridibundus TaxID=1192867 RepID=UPI002FDE1298